jgi:hypothetical protein
VDLFILDNGAQYSDRRIMYVADPGYTRAQVEALLRLLDGPNNYTAWKVLGRGVFEWFEGKATTFEKFIEEFDWRLESWNDEERFAGRVHAAQLPPELLALMPRFLKEQWYGGHPELEENKPEEPKPEEP